MVGEKERKEQQLASISAELNEVKAQKESAAMANEQLMQRNQELEALLDQQRSGVCGG